MTIRDRPGSRERAMITFKGRWRPDQQAKVEAEILQTYDLLDAKGYGNLKIPVQVYSAWPWARSGNGMYRLRDGTVRLAGLQDECRHRRVLLHEIGHHLYSLVPQHVRRSWVHWYRKQIRPLRPEILQFNLDRQFNAHTLGNFALGICLADHALRGSGIENLCGMTYREILNAHEKIMLWYFPHWFSLRCWHSTRSTLHNASEAFAEAFAIGLGGPDTSMGDRPLPLTLARRFYPMLRYAHRPKPAGSHELDHQRDLRPSPSH